MTLLRCEGDLPLWVKEMVPLAWSCSYGSRLRVVRIIPLNALPADQHLRIAQSATEDGGVFPTPRNEIFRISAGPVCVAWWIFWNLHSRVIMPDRVASCGEPRLGLSVLPELMQIGPLRWLRIVFLLCSRSGPRCRARPYIANTQTTYYVCTS